MKIQIFGMADDRRKILDTMYSYSQQIADHIIKCVVYTSKHRDFNHWIDEITSYLTKINRMTPKKGFRIKYNDYMNNLFVGIGDEQKDAELSLEIFQDLYVKKGGYPDFEITYELYHNLYLVYWEIAETLSNKLGKYDEITAKYDIKHDLIQVLNKYVKVEI